jgi:hypothetical protein
VIFQIWGLLLKQEEVWTKLLGVREQIVSLAEKRKIEAIFEYGIENEYERSTGA